MIEFDIKQRLFLAGKYHSTAFNIWFQETFATSIEEAIAEERARVVGEIKKKIEYWSKLHDESMPKNTLIGYHADSCIRALDNRLSSLKEINPKE